MIKQETIIKVFITIMTCLFRCCNNFYKIFLNSPCVSVWFQSCNLILTQFPCYNWQFLVVWWFLGTIHYSRKNCFCYILEAKNIIPIRVCKCGKTSHYQLRKWWEWSWVQSSRGCRSNFFSSFHETGFNIMYPFC